MATRPENVSASQLKEVLQPVVLGADYCAYSYVRTFWEAYGVSSIVFAAFEVKSVSCSDFVHYHTVPGFDQEDVLLSTLAKEGEKLCAKGRVPFLVSSGDFYARIISEHKAELEQWFYTPVCEFDVLDYVTNKENFYKLCERMGIPYPKTRFLDCSDPSAVADDSGFMYPIVAKPSNSATYHYAEFEGKKKVFIIDDPAELKRIFSALQSSPHYNDKLIIQEFIPGGDTHMYAVNAYTNRNSDPVYTICTHVGLEDHSPQAIGNPVVTVPEWHQELADSAERFLKEVGYHGMCGFDIKRDDRDGSFKFFEINARPMRSSWLVMLSGINYARLQVEDAVLGVDPEPVTPKDGWVYGAVPSSVVRRCIPDSPFKESILKAYAEGRTSYGPDWDKDNFAHRFWTFINYYHQVQKFKKYLPEGDRA